MMSMMTSTPSINIVRHLSQKKGAEKNSVECALEKALETISGKEGLKRLSWDDAQRNNEFQSILKSLVELGKCAEADSQILEKLSQQKSKVVGLTGMEIDQHWHMGPAPMPGPSQLGSTQFEKECEEYDPKRDPKESLLEKFQQVMDLAEKLNSDEEADKWTNQLAAMKQQLNKTMASLKTDQIPENSQTQQGVQERLMRHIEVEQVLKGQRTEIEQHVKTIPWLSSLERGSEDFSELMEHLKHYQCWSRVKLCEKIEESEFSMLKGRIQNSLTRIWSHVQRGIEESNKLVDTDSLQVRFQALEGKLLDNAWFAEMHPPTNIMMTKGTTQVSFRIFIENWKLDSVAVISQEGEKLISLPANDKGLEWTNEEGQIHIHLSNSILKGAISQKRYSSNSFASQKMYRIVCNLEWKNKKVECVSLPFTVRTGSSQLWECEGALVWCSFQLTKLDDMKLDFKSYLEVPKVMSMLQTLMHGYSNSKVFTEEEKQALRNLLMHKYKGEEKSGGKSVTMEMFMKEPLPSLKENQKSPNDPPPLKCSFFNYFVAGLNTYNQLEKDVMMRTCQFPVFIDYLHVQKLAKNLRDQTDATAIIRVSQRSFENIHGQTPYADICIHVYCDSECVSVREKCTEMKSLHSMIGAVTTKFGTVTYVGLEQHPLYHFENASICKGKVNDYFTKCTTMKKLEGVDETGRPQINDATNNFKHTEDLEEQTSASGQGKKPKLTSSSDNSEQQIEEEVQTLENVHIINELFLQQPIEEISSYYDNSEQLLEDANDLFKNLMQRYNHNA